MNNKFDELTKQMAQSVTRRVALKKFGLGLAGMALAGFGLGSKAGAATIMGQCVVAEYYRKSFKHGWWLYAGQCTGLSTNGACYTVFSADCPAGQNGKPQGGLCGQYLDNKACSFTV